MVIKPKFVSKPNRILEVGEAKSGGETSESNDESCAMYHRDYTTNYSEECDQRYFAENEALNGVKCASCFIVVAATGKDDTFVPSFVPSLACPAYFCSRRNRYKCKCVLCAECYNNKVLGRLASNCRSKRRSRAN